MRLINTASLVAALTLAVAPAAVHAFGVDTNLGTLAPGTYPFSGTTIGADNDFDTYSNNTPGAKWDQDRVFQFTTSVTSTISLTSNDPDASPVGIDHDFFLLNSLATTVNSSGYNQATGLGNGNVYISGTFGTFPAGTYYLSVDAYQGAPANVSIPGAFAGNLTIAAFVPPPPPPSTLVTLGGAVSGSLSASTVKFYSFTITTPQAVSFDTYGTTGLLNASGNPDTELFLFDSNGLLLGTDDDDGTLAGGGELLSILNSGDELPALLPAGTYYLGIGGFNTTSTGNTFNLASTSTFSGAFNINGITSAVPEPTTLAALALGGVLARRRRA